MAKSEDKKKSKKSKDVEKKAKKKKPSGEMKLSNLSVEYRPNSINDLVGQEQTVSQIRGMFKGGKMPQTFLISGDTGCGKTTTARILARTALCTDLADGLTPCGECFSCKAGDAHPDILEANMAVTRGIDDARAMVDQATSMPSMGKKRIFIIDEVHMWTTQAESAFLKPLEEPQPHTIWILCTTDPQKLKKTILDRCKKLPIRQIEPKLLMKRIAYISKKEGFDLTEREDGEKILRTISDMSSGHMRPAIELLESVLLMLHSGDKLDTKQLLTAILTSGEGDIEKAAAYLLASVLNGDLKDVVQQVRGSENVRGLLNKTRWLIQYLLDNAVGMAKYTPYSGKIFASVAKQNDIKIKLKMLIRMQMLLIDIETKMNSMSLDEGVLMLSMVGSFMDDNDLVSSKKEK